MCYRGFALRSVIILGAFFRGDLALIDFSTEITGGPFYMGSRASIELYNDVILTLLHPENRHQVGAMNTGSLSVNALSTLLA